MTERLFYLPAPTEGQTFAASLKKIENFLISCKYELGFYKKKKARNSSVTVKNPQEAVSDMSFKTQLSRRNQFFFKFGIFPN